MSTSGSAYNELVSKQLEKSTNELRQLQQLLTLEGVDPRVLLDFREAVDQVRHTAWSVQQWLELTAKKKDVTSVLEVLTEHRIRVATRLNRDLAVGVESGEVVSRFEGLEALRAAAEGLLGRLRGLLGRT